MSKKYEHHVGEQVTKELLDSIKFGDLIKVNDWTKPLRVKGVIKDYFVMATKQFGKSVYSVCEKKRRVAGRYNRMMPNMFHVSRDAWVFGWINFEDFDFEDEDDSYQFDNPKWVEAYLKSFEEVPEGRELSRLSERAGIPIEEIYIKRS